MSQSETPCFLLELPLNRTSVWFIHLRITMVANYSLMLQCLPLKRRGDCCVHSHRPHHWQWNGYILSIVSKMEDASSQGALKTYSSNTHLSFLSRFTDMEIAFKRNGTHWCQMAAMTQWFQICIFMFFMSTIIHSLCIKEMVEQIRPAVSLKHTLSCVYS